jgi:hypothetical protein
MHVGVVLLAMLSCLGCPNFAEAAEARLGNRVVCYATNWAQVRSSDRKDMQRAVAYAAPQFPASRCLLPSTPCMHCLCLQYRPGACSWLPNQLNATLCTHVNFAFGSLTKGSVRWSLLAGCGLIHRSAWHLHVLLHSCMHHHEML